MRLTKKFGRELIKPYSFQSILSTAGTLYGSRGSIRLLTSGGNLSESDDEHEDSTEMFTQKKYEE